MIGPWAAPSGLGPWARFLLAHPRSAGRFIPDYFPDIPVHLMFTFNHFSMVSWLEVSLIMRGSGFQSSRRFGPPLDENARLAKPVAEG